MSIKQQLLEAAKKIDTAVKLDSIFESADLSAEVKSKFETVFESAVKAKAIELAETHINDIAEKSEEMVEAGVKAEIADLTENLNKYLDHVAGTWLEENKIAVQSGMKVDMFESLMVGMKDLFVEHNVIVPTEEVDVVAELEAEITESRDLLNVAIDDKSRLEKTINEMKRDSVVFAATSDLTESQKEKVSSLIEGIEYNELFEGKLTAIVEMTASKVVAEAVVEDVQAQVVVESEVADPNFKEEEVIVESAKVDPMSVYLTAL